MAFNKRRNNNEGQHQPLPEKPKSGFIISDKSFYTATFISSLTITVLLIILVVIKAAYSISETDIQSICQITAGLSGLTLAIPLFLKDFDVSSSFWRQFYLIAITFLFATFIGLFSFLQTNATESKSIIIYLWFFFSLTISINITNVGRIGKWVKSKSKVNISSNPLTNFFASYFILLISLLFAKGDFLIYGTILFTIYGFYLTLSLMVSILVELFIPKPKEDDNEMKLRKAIEYLVNKYKNEPIEEQNLIDRLRKEVFFKDQEIVSRSKVKEIVTEMDLETDINFPKVSIYDYDHSYIIPRWTSEFDTILKKANPKFIVLYCSSSSYESKDLRSLLSDNHFLKNYGDKLYNILSKNSGLSVELLKDNSSLTKKYKVLKFINDRTNSGYSSSYYNYLLLVDIYSNENSVIVSNDYHYHDGDFFTKKEYEFILRKNNAGEVLFDDYISMDKIEAATRK
jgi:hypothetical protein